MCGKVGLNSLEGRCWRSNAEKVTDSNQMLEDFIAEENL